MLRIFRSLDRGRAPLGFIGMIVLILFAESQIARLDVDLTPIWAADWRQAGRAARKAATDAEILCFGDSLAKLGIAPRVIEEASGHPTYNLAVSVGQIPSSYFLLRRALRAGAQPKAVVLDLIPHLLAEGPRYNARLWADFLELDERLDLAITAGDPDFFASNTLARHFPSIRNRFEMRSTILGSLRGERISNFPAIAWHWRNWRVNQGAQMMPSVDHFAGNAELWPAELYPAEWTIHPVNRIYLERFLGLAASHDLPVYLTIMPFSPEVQARRESLGLDSSYTEFIQGVQDRHDRLIVLDARHSGYDHSLHIDPIHLDRHGAEAFSLDLASLVATSLRDGEPSSRWVEMPQYRPRSNRNLIEDLNQSQVALEFAGDGRRR